jgi:DNA-binding SARP family transcriptional activator/Flp pilus assembly protein TadD
VVRTSSIKICLFGEFRVLREGIPIGRGGWDRQKTRSLLKLLLTRPGRVFSRDEILDALWPETPPEAAERSLRVTVSLLRRTLEPDLERGSESRYIRRSRPGYLFDPDANCEVDCWEFEERQARGQEAQESGRIEEAIEQYQGALDLVRGEFLAEDPYEEWAMEARGEWLERRLSILASLSECLALRGRYSEAVEICNKAMALDEFREDLHRRLMLYHYCAGEQALALRAFRRYARKLREQMGAAPSPELARLKERIEGRDVPGVDDLRRYPRPRRPLRLPYSLSRTHFVGRDREYALLTERLRETITGAGGVVAVEGEAGVGKTRLAEEFLGYAGSRGIQTLSGRCYERDLGPPLEPVTEALDSVADISKLVPGVSDSHEEEDSYLRTAKPYDVTRIYHSLTRQIVRESRCEGHEALVLFVDDVQWADPATLDFLSYLAKRISGERVLAIFSYRREQVGEISGWLEGLAERRVLTTLSLGRLSLEDLTQILTRMSSRRFGELSLLADFLYRESEGNPFYAVEYLRWLIESGAVRIDARRRISRLESAALLVSALPSGVRALIRARLNSLDEDSRELLELAAVVGRAFDLGLLCAVSGREESAIYGTIEPLIASGIIVEISEETYRFSHDKLRQALYEGIGSHRRRELHLRVARVLEEDAGEPSEIAHHYLRAKEWRSALESLVQAAREAEEKYYWDAALENYSRALDAMEKLPGAGDKRFELLAARERLLEHMDRREERARAVGEMFELANRMGDRTKLAQVCVRRIGVLAALSNPAAAEQAGREAAEIFQELGDAAGVALAHREVGYVLWTNGDHAGSLEANFRALRIHRNLGDRRGEVGDVGNIAEVYRGMGNYREALRWTQTSVRIYQELGDGIGEAMRLATAASIHRELGELEAALPLVLRSLRICTSLGVKNLLVAQHSACGTLYLGLGAPHRALEHFRAAARLGREMGYTRDEGFSTMSLGALLEQTGDPAGAAEAYRRAIELLQESYETSGATKELSGKADALTLLARVLHRSLDRPEEALESYEASAEICRQLGNLHLLRKVLLGSAGLCWKMGHLEDAALRYEEALDLAREQSEAVHEATALASLSVVYRDQGRLMESLRSSKEALGTLRDLEDLQAEAYVLSSLAESYDRLGYYPSALSCLKRSLRLRRKVRDSKGEVRVLHDLARVYGKLGDTGRARDASEEAARKEIALEVVSVGKRRG